MKPSVLICQTAWKGSLSPDETNAIVADVVKAIHPDWTIACLPLADGGDGWLDCLQTGLPGVLEIGHLTVTGPVPHQQVLARYAWDPQARRIYLESADIHGMRRLPGRACQPMIATSYGVGEALLLLRQQYPDAREWVVAVGGSASTDGGLGLLQALGWQFFDETCREMTEPMGAGALASIVRVQPPKNVLNFPPLTLLTDVDAWYADAPRLFGPQKGVSPEAVSLLTQEFNRLGMMLNPQATTQKGSGAAGGLGFALMTAFPNVVVESGIAWTARLMGFEAALQSSDWVITGEGRFDETSLMGKVTGYVLDNAQAYKKPVWILCGKSPFREFYAPQVRVLAMYPEAHKLTPEDFDRTAETIKARLGAVLSTIE